MYTCPTDDIHSIYLDNELPVVYVKEYEKHLSECKECAEKFRKLKAVHDLLQMDKNSVVCDDNFSEESFARLTTKLHYSQNSKFVRKPEFNVAKYVMPFAAAAAVFLAVFIPFGFSSGNEKFGNLSKIAPIERPQNRALSSQNIVFNGNLHSGLAQNVNTENSINNFKDVDVFRPDFNSGNEYTIQIRIPGLTAQDYRTMEIRLPQTLITGPLR